MPTYNLRNFGHGNVGVSLPLGDLKRAGIVEEDGTVPNNQQAHVDRLDDRVFLVRIPDGGGELPDPKESEVVKQFAAQRLIERGRLDLSQPAD